MKVLKMMTMTAATMMMMILMMIFQKPLTKPKITNINLTRGKMMMMMMMMMVMMMMTLKHEDVSLFTSHGHVPNDQDCNEV